MFWRKKKMIAETGSQLFNSQILPPSLTSDQKKAQELLENHKKAEAKKERLLLLENDLLELLDYKHLQEKPSDVFFGLMHWLPSKTSFRERIISLISSQLPPPAKKPKKNK